jgi:hypothetical protein
MATEYRLFIFNEFDWNYQDFKKEQLIQFIELKHWNIEASIPYCIIINIEKNTPEKVVKELKNFSIDNWYYQINNESILHENNRIQI